MADSNLPNLTEITVLASGDLWYVVGDPAGTAVDRKATAGTVSLADSVKAFYGSGADASIYYDGTHMVVNAKEVGDGALNITAADVTIYDAVNNADTSLAIGNSATERLLITVNNGPSNQTAESVKFSTETASGAADAGQFSFVVDGGSQLTINDSGINAVIGATTANAGTFSDVNSPRIDLGTAAATLGVLTMSGDTSGTVTIQTASAAGTYTLTLPTTDGDASEFLQTNGSGVLSWASAGGGLDGATQAAVGGGDGNTYVGNGSGAALIASSALGNTLLGADAGAAIDFGDYNVLIGHQAGDGITSKGGNIAIGRDALGGASNTAEENIAIGDLAGDAITSGDFNVAVGTQALGGVTTGTNNVAIGNRAGNWFDAEDDNIAIGTQALGDVSFASNRCTAVGHKAGLNITSGGDDCVLIGSTCGDALTTSSGSNVAVGSNALGIATTASNNIAIGHNAGDALTTGDANIIIGYDVDVPTAANSNQMTIGNLLFSDAVNQTGTTVSDGGLGLGGMPTDGTLLSLITGARTRTAVTAVGCGIDLIADTADHDNGAATVAIGATVGIGIQTHTNDSANLTYTDIASLYIAGVPVASTNVLITNDALSIWAKGVGLMEDGIRIGANSTDNEIDDATDGSGSTTLYIGNASINVTSDVRVKADIHSWTGSALDKLGALQVREYDYTSDVPFANVYDGQYVGLLAQDVYEIAPWAVNTQGGAHCEKCLAGERCHEHPNPWTVNSELMLGLIVKSIQELKADNEALRRQLSLSKVA